MKKLIIATLLLLNISYSKAQDFHLSMYDAAPLFLNPAMTGIIEGDWRLHAQYRTQWKSVNFEPHQTALVSFDIPYKKWGFGGQINNYRSGRGNYNALQGLGSVGYTIPINREQTHIISFGTQFGLTQKSVEHQLLTFNNQYSISNGGTFDNSLNNGESFGGQSIVVPELNVGFLYFYSKQQSRLNPFFGATAFNLLTPEETFFEDDNLLPMRFYIHTGTRVNVTETLYIIPKVLLMRQGKFTELTFAGDIGYYMKSSETYLLGGLIYRNKDAFVISFGARKTNYIAKLAYDINTSSLTSASTGRGGFEISFTYLHQTKDSKIVKICPRL